MVLKPDNYEFFKARIPGVCLLNMILWLMVDPLNFIFKELNLTF